MARRPPGTAAAGAYRHAHPRATSRAPGTVTLMATAPYSTTLTAEELLTGPDRGRCELVEGVLREMNPAGAEHGVIALEIGVLLRDCRLAHGGLVFAAETGFLLARDTDTVRAPDAAYVTAARAQDAGPPAGDWPGAPGLAAEVVSPNDTYTEVHEKAFGWLRAGTLVVLVVDPAARHVTRYRSAEDVAVLSPGDTVDCAPAMPDFAPTADQLLNLS